ncbi:hypothetical protein KCV87_10965 [Actinosynnema pretiosum subsp. pretiosum]|uniref:Uncharacterized protein n=1 Tax=Actinosynnema pretiosum subsp. pretiosum TaxID=103721 RepID=A0AA45LC27_9PSEU|nr:hypothetical protein APASM_1844 [Actinosynnema pretiosum subsp. pretiosum]QUF06523.1 hypothetical protein KCV87_10965 [Actinosynnema pretiosum subsp. pretiosum]
MSGPVGQDGAGESTLPGLVAALDPLACRDFLGGLSSGKNRTRRVAALPTVQRLVVSRCRAARGVVGFSLRHPERTWVTEERLVGRTGARRPCHRSWEGCLARVFEPGGIGPDEQAGCLRRVVDAGYREEVAHYPPGAFWRMQAVELALFPALAAGVAWFGFQRVSRAG